MLIKYAINIYPVMRVILTYVVLERYLKVNFGEAPNSEDSKK